MSKSALVTGDVVVDHYLYEAQRALPAATRRMSEGLAVSTAAISSLSHSNNLVSLQTR